MLFKLKASLPFHGAWIDWIAAVVLAGSIVWIVYRIRQNVSVQKWMKSISLGMFASAFEKHLREQKKLHEFTDDDVADFINSKFFSQNIVLRTTGKKTASENIIEELKAFFIAE